MQRPISDLTVDSTDNIALAASKRGGVKSALQIRSPGTSNFSAASAMQHANVLAYLEI